MRGYSAIGLDNPKTPANVGSVMRAAYCYGVSLVAIAGRRFMRAPTDVMKAWRHIPTLHVDDLHDAIPYDCEPIAVDLTPRSKPLAQFTHPERAFYVFGAEDATLGDRVLSWCPRSVYVPTRGSMNLAACANVILYDRAVKRNEWPAMLDIHEAVGAAP